MSERATIKSSSVQIRERKNRTWKTSIEDSRARGYALETFRFGFFENGREEVQGNERTGETNERTSRPKRIDRSIPRRITSLLMYAPGFRLSPFLELFFPFYLSHRRSTIHPRIQRHSNYRSASRSPQSFSKITSRKNKLDLESKEWIQRRASFSSTVKRNEGHNECTL